MINANFIVDPNDLKKVVVPDAITIKFIDISRINFLGETGKKMALAGFKFLVTKKLAEKLIKDKIAVLASDISDLSVHSRRGVFLSNYFFQLFYFLL